MAAFGICRGSYEATSIRNPRMEMRIHVPGRLVADVRRCLQVRKPRHLHAARRTEVVEQRALAGGTDAGDFVQFALPDVLRPSAPGAS